MPKNQNKELDQVIEQKSPQAAKKMLGDESGKVATSIKSKASPKIDRTPKEIEAKTSFFDNLFGSSRARFITFAIAFAVVGVGFVVASFAATSSFGDYFSPAATTSRQAMAAFAYRRAGSPTIQTNCSPTGLGGTGNQRHFSDVPLNSEFCKEIVWATQAGITSGYSDGTFRPDNAVSREVATVFLARLDSLETGANQATVKSAGAGSCDKNKPFDDVEINSTFCKAIQAAKLKGYIKGTPSGNKVLFKPSEGATRQAIAVMFWNRSKNPEPKTTTPIFKDVPATHTFFKAIQWFADEQLTKGSDTQLTGPTNLIKAPTVTQQANETTTSAPDTPSKAPDVTNTTSSKPVVNAATDPLAGKTLCVGTVSLKTGPVGILQTRLRAMGYLNVATTGTYDSKTEGAMKSWRLVHHNTSTQPGCYYPGLHTKFIQTIASGWKIDPDAYNFLVALAAIQPSTPPASTVTDSRPPAAVPTTPAIPPVVTDEKRICTFYTNDPETNLGAEWKKTASPVTRDVCEARDSVHNYVNGYVHNEIRTISGQTRAIVRMVWGDQQTYFDKFRMCAYFRPLDAARLNYTLGDCGTLKLKGVGEKRWGVSAQSNATPDAPSTFEEWQLVE